MMKEINYQTKTTKNKNRINISTGILYAFAFGAIVYFKIHGPREVSTQMMVHDICHVVALFICAILIGCIKYNVKRNRMFIKANANLIKAIGMIVSFTGVIPQFIYLKFFYSLTSFYDFNWFLFVIGSFIFALGEIFQHAVKMKEEQDLTI